jgi:hypothetical protein
LRVENARQTMEEWWREVRWINAERITICDMLRNDEIVIVIRF